VDWELAEEPVPMCQWEPPWQLESAMEWMGCHMQILGYSIESPLHKEGKVASSEHALSSLLPNPDQPEPKGFNHKVHEAAQRKKLKPFVFLCVLCSEKSLHKKQEFHL